MGPSETRKLARQTSRIHGWFSPEAAGLFALLAEVQKEHRIRGDLFEIGVHHGKSAVLLGNLAEPDETLWVCDIFGSQDQNVSTSGAGDRQIFERNMAKYAPSAKVEILQMLSTELSREQAGGPFRFFHIDGGHLAEEALSDLELAVSVVGAGGVIVVDDPFRSEWPGVTEAILRFLQDQSEYIPLALGFNKLVLTRSGDAPAYRSAVEGSRIWDFVNHRVYERKALPIEGHNVPIFFVPTYRQAPWLQSSVAEVRTGLSRGARVLQLARTGGLVEALRRRARAR